MENKKGMTTYISGVSWGIYICGILSILGHTFICPLPLTGFFISLFGIYSILVTCILIASITWISKIYKKNKYELLKLFWEVKKNNNKLSLNRLTIFTSINFLSSICVLFLLKDVFIFMSIFSMTISTSLLSIKSKEIYKELDEFKYIFEFIESKPEFEIIARKEINKGCK